MMVGRMETLVPTGAGHIAGGDAEYKLTELRDSMVVVTDTLGGKLHTLKDLVLAVSTMAEESVAKLAKGMEEHKSDQWSDWDILDGQGIQMLQTRVPELEARGPPVTAAEVQ